MYIHMYMCVCVIVWAERGTEKRQRRTTNDDNDYVCQGYYNVYWQGQGRK